MAEIKLDGVSKHFGGVVAVDNLNLEIGHGELVSLLGPSGCGKTTALRMLAGFEKLTAGEISIDGRVINNLSPQERNIGIVFQNYAVFPTMSVAKNVAYGLKIRKVEGQELKKRIADVLELVGLAGYENRMPSQLSGGQLQRVALARALVIRPNVLLLDEPLSNLDAALRVSIRKEIRKIQQEMGITTVFVTHDQEEAMSISDRVAVMRKGHLIQMGSPMEMYNNPDNSFVASFLGHTTLISGTVQKVDGERTIIAIPGGEMQAKTGTQVSVGTEVWVSIRPHHIRLGNELDANKLSGKVEYLETLGSLVRGEIISSAGIPFTFEITDPQGSAIPTPGSSIEFAISPANVTYGPKNELDKEIFQGQIALSA